MSIEPFTFPDMMDDEIKIKLFNDKYKEIDSDWVIAADSDEFIFTNDFNSNLNSHLETKNDKQVIFTKATLFGINTIFGVVNKTGL